MRLTFGSTMILYNTPPTGWSTNDSACSLLVDTEMNDFLMNDFFELELPPL